MNHEEYQTAGNYWLKIDAAQSSVPREELYKAITEYIADKDTCALATVFKQQPRVTPIEYLFYKDCFYLFTEGGQKFFALEENSSVALAIFDKFAGFHNLKGLQIQGTATVISYASELYREIAALKNIDLKVLEQRGHRLYLIAVKPAVADFLNSDFKKANYHVRQQYKW